MVTVTKDLSFLGKGKSTAKLTVILVSDPWMRSEVTKLALDRPEYEVNDLGEQTELQRLAVAAVSMPLIGDPLIHATLDKKAITPAKLPAFLSKLAAGINPVVLNIPWASSLIEDTKDDQSAYTIIRQTDVAKRAERNALIDKVLSTLTPTQTDTAPWHDLFTEWYKTADEDVVGPTTVRLLVDYTHTLAVDSRNILDTVKATRCLQQEDTASKYPDLMTHLANLARSKNSRTSNMLLQQIAMHSTDDTERRKLAAAIEQTALEINTCTDQISQPEDERVHAYRRGLIKQHANLSPKQLIYLNMLAQRLAAAIRRDPNCLARCASILHSET